MRILGIDPGYGITGYGIIDKTSKGLKMVTYGAIKTPAAEGLPVRLAMIFDEIKRIVKDYKIDEVAIEELFFYNNPKTAIKVAEARGVTILAASKDCGALFEYTPMQVKQAITGKGRAEKKQVEANVKEILLIEEKIKPDDAADALAIAICHAQKDKTMREESYV